jgi:4-hydroxy-3-methylbut-2-enyl diphosphate reductase IspH
LETADAVAVVGARAVSNPQLLKKIATTLAVNGLTVAPQKQVREN